MNSLPLSHAKIKSRPTFSPPSFHHLLFSPLRLDPKLIGSHPPPVKSSSYIPSPPPTTSSSSDLMDDFPGLLARDFGFRPQANSAPMKPSVIGSGSARSAASPTAPAFVDIFGGPPAYARSASASSPHTSSFDSIFDGFKDPNPSPSPSPASSMPVFDKPVYDDDIFDGIPGMRSSAKVEYDDVFGSMSSPPKNKGHAEAPGQYDGPLASLGKGSSSKEGVDSSAFDDLIPGFGRSSTPKKRKNACRRNRAI